ncbi:DUF3152 domain-containing protein [Micromonosporaceae bacterium B7E4]
MRRPIALLAAVVAALWLVAGTALFQLLDRDETPARSAPLAVPTTTLPAWTPPVVLVDLKASHLVDQDQAQAAAAQLAADPRGWRTDLDHIAIRIVLPGTDGIERMPGLIGRALFDTDVVLISAEAWTSIGQRFAVLGGTLDEQRAWVFNHEVGHILGHPHEECPGDGPAPVMRATTYDIGTCSLNVWPNPWYAP